jgi:hypothetical protein
MAQPGDVITVHEGIYREEITPPRGGTSDKKRIVYQAAPGENVEIRGSEVVTGWTEESDGVWKTEIPNSLFGNVNPFADEIIGDWFNPMGRKHHTGCVYQDGQWLIEAADKDALIAKKEENPQPLINMAWFSVNGTEYEAAKYSEFDNVKTAPSTEPCGSCIGWIYDGSWASYADVNFGRGAETIDLRLALPGHKVRVEIRLEGPQGPKIGECYPTRTGDWQKWKTFTADIKRQEGLQALCFVFRQLVKKKWFAEVGEETTAVWATFNGDNPNNSLTEVNARQTVFYPRKPFVNYITVRGFKLRHAAPKWAPPTAEQMGLIGTHWSKGWIIEDNDISHSINVGITLGKYGDEFDNAGPTAQAYLDSIDRARENGWNKETVGSHIVRNNEISYCEQAGMVGSMGAAFSEIVGNHIHHIHLQARFTGAEMGGIKFHAAIDTLIQGNRIHDSGAFGLWLDWMTQGTRVSENLFYRNGIDLFLEVNHGPFVIDNNLFLSGMVMHLSQGGAYVHNLFAGKLRHWADPRATPYFKPHSTEKIADHTMDVGDDRFYNNMFVGNGEDPLEVTVWEPTNATIYTSYGLMTYEITPQFPQTGGNVYYNRALPCSGETAVLIHDDPDIELEEKGDEVFLTITIDEKQDDVDTPLVTGKLLGKAEVPNAPFEDYDGSSLKIDTDYFGKKRDRKNPSPGPFENPETGRIVLKVW